MTIILFRFNLKVKYAIIPNYFIKLLHIKPKLIINANFYFLIIIILFKIVFHQFSFFCDFLFIFPDYPIINQFQKLFSYHFLIHYLVFNFVINLCLKNYHNLKTFINYFFSKVIAILNQIVLLLIKNIWVHKKH